jgi:hypothetical protein
LKTALRGAELGSRRTPNDRHPVFWGAHASGVWGSASRRAEFVSEPPKTEPSATRGSLPFLVRFTNRLALRDGGKIRFKALLKLLAAHLVQGIVGGRRVPPRNLVEPSSFCCQFVGPWLSLVERLVRDEEAASSNLAGPTISFLQIACSPARFERSSTAARGARKRAGASLVAEPDGGEG